ncbi:flagellar hook-associated protein 3 FlgL [Nitrobacteraceae bacterium AZCC 1564]
MTINGVSGRTSYLSAGLINIKNQLDLLTQQLASGKKSTTYAGLGLNAATATGLRAQLATLSSYADTDTLLNTRINVANLSLQGISDAGSEVKKAATGATLTLDSTGQTPGQKTAQGSFSQLVALLNTTAAGRYLFSGRATDTPSTEPADVIMNGRGAQVGLKQMIYERGIADGTSGLGRLTITSPTTTSVTIGEDAAGSPFGLKLDSISTNLTGATVTPPAPGTPPAGQEMSIDLGATNPNEGEKVTFTFKLPDGTSERIELTATNTNPPPEGSFLIGADTTATATNLKGAVNTAVGKLANTALVAASAMTASNNFFSSNPPQRVDTTTNPPVALRNGTPADTVFWYTGEMATGPNDSARGTAVIGIDSSISVQYGARANEDAFVTQLKNVAVYAAVTTDANNPNANDQLTSLNSRIITNLSDHPGQQSIENIQSDFANAQVAVKNAKDRQTQIGATAQSMLDSIQGINDDEVAAKIMALQTSLQASYQTTSALYQMSLLKFLPPA